MGKNQRHSKEEMFLSIELWQDSGMSQKAFCDKEELSLPTFGYWLRKYKKEKESATEPNKAESFIPLKVPGIDSMIRSCEVSTERIRVPGINYRWRAYPRQFFYPVHGSLFAEPAQVHIKSG